MPSITLSVVDQAATFVSPAGFNFAVMQTQNIGELTIQFEATVDDGATWFMIPAQAIGRGTQVTQVWTNGRWYLDTYAFGAIRARVTSLVSGSVQIDCTPAELATTATLADSLSNRMPVNIEGSQTLDGRVNLTVSDIQKRRLEEALLLRAIEANYLSQFNNDSRDASSRGYEVR